MIFNEFNDKILFNTELEEDDEDEVEVIGDVESDHEQLEKDKYLEDVYLNTTDITQTNKKRVKRQSDYEYTPTKTRCPLLLVADYRFFQEMGASNTKTTISYLVNILFKCRQINNVIYVSLFNIMNLFQISLIDRVHKIYNDTLWQDRQVQKNLDMMIFMRYENFSLTCLFVPQDMDGFKGMGFVIKKILVHSEPTRVRGGEAHYNMVREKWDVRNLLEVRTEHV